MRNRVRRPSPALVVACIALVVALGGTSYATVLQVPRNSVGTVQLQRNAVKAAKIAPNAVRTGHVLDGTLLVADFKAGQIPQGPKGDKGDTGTAGATNVVVRTASVTSTGSATATANCNAGERAVGGGFDIGGWGANVTPFRSRPTPATAGSIPTGWTATSFNQTNIGAAIGVVAYAICAAP
jgi:hypothetical protein